MYALPCKSSTFSVDELPLQDMVFISFLVAKIDRTNLINLAKKGNSYYVLSFPTISFVNSCWQLFGEKVPKCSLCSNCWFSFIFILLLLLSFCFNMNYLFVVMPPIF